MKKIINNPDNVVDEMISGFLAAYGNKFKKVNKINGIIKNEIKQKVNIVIGGGSGHEPLFLGFVGEGLADGVAIGNVFAAPPAQTIQEVAMSVDTGKGVLFVYGNYAGDVLNFEMASELLEISGVETRTVLVKDDVASAPRERKEDRRGIAGDVLVIKIAGAAAEKGFNLDEVTKLTQKASDETFSIGMALSPGTIPSSGKPTFTLEDDEIEIGMGIHGEPGIERRKIMMAKDIVNEMMASLLKEGKFKAKDEVVLLINGLGSTTLLEQFIVNNEVIKILDSKGIIVHDTDINSYCTTQEMGGVSISMMRLNDELKMLYDMPAKSPYYFK